MCRSGGVTTISNPLQALLFFLLWIYATAGYAQHASLDDGVLSVPYIAYGEQYYSVELQIIAGTEPLRLRMLAAVATAAKPLLSASTFSDGVLFIPDIAYQDSTFWAELRLVSDNEFELVDSGPNQSVSDSNQLGLSIEPNWIRIEGDASDIGVGANGAIWVLGKDERPGGFGIYYRDGAGWQRVDGAAVRIDVGPDGNPWIVNDQHQIHRWQDGRWIQMQGDARDIGIGADGSVWVAAGGGIFRWLGGQEWARTSGSAVRIDVDPNGNPWVIDHTNDIHQLVNGRWVRRPGAARDIGIGADGSVWVIGTSSGSGGHDIFRWNGSDWNQVHGSARQVSVDRIGNPWVLGSGGEIYRGQ